MTSLYSWIRIRYCNDYLTLTNQIFSMDKYKCLVILTVMSRLVKVRQETMSPYFIQGMRCRWVILHIGHPRIRRLRALHRCPSQWRELHRIPTLLFNSRRQELSITRCPLHLLPPWEDTHSNRSLTLYPRQLLHYGLPDTSIFVTKHLKQQL